MGHKTKPYQTSHCWRKTPENNNNNSNNINNSDSQLKKRTCWIADFGVPADHWVKLKEIKKRD